MLSNGMYLGREILAFSGNWLLIYDPPYNYMVFNALKKQVLNRYNKSRLPYNDVGSIMCPSDSKGRGAQKMTAYYSSFESGLKNMCEIVANNGFLR